MTFTITDIDSFQMLKCTITIVVMYIRSALAFKYEIPTHSYL